MFGWLAGYNWRDIKSAIEPDWLIYVFWLVAYIVVSLAFDLYYKKKAIPPPCPSCDPKVEGICPDLTCEHWIGEEDGSPD